jgi:tetratricopeptide (TPR) repeat protein
MGKNDKSDIQTNAERRHSQYYATVVLKEIGELYDRSGNEMNFALARFDREETNIRTGQKWAARHVRREEKSIEIAVLCNLYADLAWDILTLRLPPTEWLEWLKPALIAPRRMNLAADVCLGNIGAAYAALGDYKRAQRFYQKAYKISLKTGSPKNQAKFLNNIGNIFLLTGPAEEAQRWYLKRLSAAQNLSDASGEAAAYLGLGAVCRSLGEFAEALSNFENAHRISSDNQLRRVLPICLNNLALTFLDLGDSVSAIFAYEQSLIAAREIDDWRVEAAVLINLEKAKSDFYGKTPTPANYERALALARQRSDQRTQANALAALAEYYEMIGDSLKYIELFNEQLLILRQIGDRSSECTALSQHAEKLVRKNEFRQAVKHYERSLQIARDISEPLQEANALLGLGNLYPLLNNHKTAGDYYNQALEIFQKLKHRGGIAYVSLGLGNLCLQGRLYSKAFNYLFLATNLFRQINDAKGIGLSFYSTGRYCFETGDLHSAALFFQESLVSYEATSDLHNQATVLNYLGRAYQEMTDYEQALESFSEALKIAVKIGNKLLEGVILINIGENYATRDAKDEALFHYRQSLIILQDLDKGRASFVIERIARLTTKP